METTTVSVRGIRTTLTIGEVYDVAYDRAGAPVKLRYSRLLERAANGELVFDLVAGRARVRPRSLDSVTPSVVPTPVVDVAAELAEREYRAEVERDHRLPRGACPVCGADVALRKGGKVREHGQPVCAGSGQRREEPGVPVSVEITKRGRKIIERQLAEAPVVGRSRGADLTPEEEARRAANRAREMARNVQWTCGACHRRTRQPECSNGHPTVVAPTGKRREQR